MIRQIELKTTGSSSFDSAKCFRFIENKKFWRSRYDDEILRNDVDFSQNERAKKHESARGILNSEISPEILLAFVYSDALICKIWLRIEEILEKFKIFREIRRNLQ